LLQPLPSHAADEWRKGATLPDRLRTGAGCTGERTDGRTDGTRSIPGRPPQLASFKPLPDPPPPSTTPAVIQLHERGDAETATCEPPTRLGARRKKDSESGWPRVIDVWVARTTVHCGTPAAELNY